MPDSMLFVELPISFEVQGKFLTASSSPSSPGVDTGVAKTPDGKLLLPLSLVKGKLREVLAQICSTGQTDLTEKWLNDWLGPKATDDSKPDRGRFRFSDFTTIESLALPLATDVRIAFDPERQSVKQGALQVYEVPVAAGGTAVLHGYIRFLAERSELDSIQKKLRTGLSLIDQFGSNRTVGFGRLKKVERTGTKSELMISSVSEAPEVEPGHLMIKLTPEAAFCVSKRKLSENVFESASELSGAVIKGVIASMLREVQGLHPGGPATEKEITSQPWTALARNLDKVRFTTARPTLKSDAKLAAVPPLSLVAANLLAKDKLNFRDVALCDRPCLLGSNGKYQAPAFSIDWKGDTLEQVDKAFGIQTPPRELRVRTAIDEQLRRAADNQLFAYEMVHPGQLTWIGHVYLDDVPENERSELRQVLAMLTQHGVWGIGKTKTFAEVEFLLKKVSPTDLATSSFEPLKSNRYVVCLQSPALIHDPVRAHFNDLGKGESRQQLLFDAYNEYWQTASGKSLKLVRMFASQSLAGGEYLSHRFHLGDQYQPYVLTDAGSVFVLEVVDNQLGTAKQWLQTWSRMGLPLSTHLGPIHSFTQCPYRPEEGFGEIAVNMKVHTQLKPQANEMREQL